VSQRRPTLCTAERFTRELELKVMGKHIDRLWRTGTDQLLIRFAGQKPRLLVQLGVELTTLAWTLSWPSTPSRPDYETIQLRAHLEGGRVSQVRLSEDRRLEVSLTRGDGPRHLSIQLAGRFPNLAAFNPAGQLGVALRQDRPAKDLASPPLPSGPCWATEQSEGWLEAHGVHALQSLANAALERARVAIARAVRGWRKRTLRALKAVSQDLERAERAEEDRRHGELLKGALGRIKKGATSVRLMDYMQADAPEVEVPLEPSLDPVENMQRYFRLYRKYRDATDTILERYELLETRSKEVTRLLDIVTSAESHEALEAAERGLRASGWRPAQAQRTGPKTSSRPLSYRRFTTTAGTDLLVGRGSKHNDELTFQVGRGRDLWFHSRDTPGAHVILRAPQQGMPDQACILDAATLAAWHSKARGETVIDVMWTERKHVRKPKGAPPGRVTVSDTRNVAVRMDQGRIDRLYHDAPDT
jgi:predicted ribosome quality control (RQC) complex YloA/Tae2 family protein